MSGAVVVEACCYRAGLGSSMKKSALIALARTKPKGGGLAKVIKKPACYASAVNYRPAPSIAAKKTKGGGHSNVFKKPACYALRSDIVKISADAFQSAPAWVSGGSSGRPRKGKQMVHKNPSM